MSFENSLFLYSFDLYSNLDGRYDSDYYHNLHEENQDPEVMPHLSKLEVSTFFFF